MKKRLLALLTMLFIASLALVACGGSREESSSGTNQTAVRNLPTMEKV